MAWRHLVLTGQIKSGTDRGNSDPSRFDDFAGELYIHLNTRVNTGQLDDQLVTLLFVGRRHGENHRNGIIENLSVKLSVQL
jgi:hypothetical protein